MCIQEEANLNRLIPTQQGFHRILGTTPAACASYPPGLPLHFLPTTGIDTRPLSLDSQ